MHHTPFTSHHTTTMTIFHHSHPPMRSSVHFHHQLTLPSLGGLAGLVLLNGRSVISLINHHHYHYHLHQHTLLTLGGLAGLILLNGRSVIIFNHPSPSPSLPSQSSSNHTSPIPRIRWSNPKWVKSDYVHHTPPTTSPLLSSHSSSNHLLPFGGLVGLNLNGRSVITFIILHHHWHHHHFHFCLIRCQITLLSFGGLAGLNLNGRNVITPIILYHHFHIRIHHHQCYLLHHRQHQLVIGMWAAGTDVVRMGMMCMYVMIHMRMYRLRLHHICLCRCSI